MMDDKEIPFDDSELPSIIKQNEIDIQNLQCIQNVVQEILESEIGTYKNLCLMVEQYPDRFDLVDLKSKVFEGIVLKQKYFAAIKKKYEKTAKRSIKEALLK